MARALAEGDLQTDARVKDFYAESLAVTDLSASFYLETVREGLQRC